MSQVQIVQPPRIATWLVDLFITEERTRMQEQILDQFSDMASTRGIGCARRWYWKQSAKTIAGHIARGFRTAPLLIVGVVFGGAFLLYLAPDTSEEAILRLLDFFNHHVTPYYDPAGVARREFWMYCTLLIVNLLESLIVGCLVAGVAKRREMIATMSLSFVSMGMTVTIFWELITTHHVDPPLFPKIVIDQLGASLLMIMGGLIVRELRSARTHGLLRH